MVAAGFFERVWGPSTFVSRGLPLAIALSSLGNISAQTFADGRVKQELAKDGILPFSRFWSSDWPCGAPTGGILLHWLFTVVMIIGPRFTDAYPLITNLSAYTESWVKLLVAVGILYLSYRNTLPWKNERTEPISRPVIIFWTLSLLFVITTPFLHTTVSPLAIPSFVVPTVGTSVLVGGVLYWVIWAQFCPLLSCGGRETVREPQLQNKFVRLRAWTRLLLGGNKPQDHTEYARLQAGDECLDLQ